MGYCIRPLGYKIRKWKIQYHSRVGGGNRSVDIKDNEYPSLGFSQSMSIEQAKLHCSNLNKNNELIRQQQKRINIKDRLRQDEVILNSQLPRYYIEEFEHLYLRADKKTSHWRSVKSTILALNIDIKDWCFFKDRFYRYFIEKNYSYSYTQKIINMLNKWGAFISRKDHLYFELIPYPTNYDKQKIIDNHDQEVGSKKSDPITPDMLEARGHNLLEQNYNWLYLAVWLGLRPWEVDSLLKESSNRTWLLEYDSILDKNILWVYQSKLTGVSFKDRVKPIPLNFKEQQRIVDIINSKNFKRPLNKTLKRVFGERVTCYGPRKGFVDLMLNSGVSFIAISQWMGHQNIDRTWKNYKQKKMVLLK